MPPTRCRSPKIQLPPLIIPIHRRRRCTSSWRETPRGRSRGKFLGHPPCYFAERTPCIISAGSTISSESKTSRSSVDRRCSTFRWILDCRRKTFSLLHNSSVCRRLRGKLTHQLMSNLPQERVTPSAPFSHIGVNVFGPWSVVARKTRGGVANSKRWAVIFTCLHT